MCASKPAISLCQWWELVYYPMACTFENKGKGRCWTTSWQQKLASRLRNYERMSNFHLRGQWRKECHQGRVPEKMVENIQTFPDQRTGVLVATRDLRRECQPGNNMPMKGEELCWTYKREITFFRMLRKQWKELQFWVSLTKKELIGKSRSERNFRKHSHVI